MVQKESLPKGSKNFFEKIEKNCKNLLTKSNFSGIIYTVRGKPQYKKVVGLMREKKKRRSEKRSAFAERVIDFLLDTLTATISGLIIAAAVKLFGW